MMCELCLNPFIIGDISHAHGEDEPTQNVDNAPIHTEQTHAQPPSPAPVLAEELS